jgi:transposase
MTQRLDHLGIVAGVCNRIGLIRQIDTFVGETNRKVSVGQAVQAMVLNGLGFVGRPLYLAPEFLSNKPIDILISDGLTAEDFNDDSLGRALDALFEAGVTEVFAYVAASVVRQAGVAMDYVHLDNSSIALHGEYEIMPDEEAGAIAITHGYSRDHRPDLKQAVISLICTHQASLPVWLAALDGNQADSSAFPVIVKAYIEQLEEGQEPPYLVADTALYSSGTLQEFGDEVRWVTRVPGSVRAVKNLYQSVDIEHMIPTQDGAYRALELCSAYGDVRQRWLLVYSEGLYRREGKWLRKAIDQERQEAEKQLRRLSRRRYPSPDATRAAVETRAEDWRFHTPQVEFIRHSKYHRPGRPAADQKPDYYVWQLTGQVIEDEQAVQAALRTKGKFVIATNILETEALPTEDLLALYKGQNATVERGFRFLKDPLFFAHSLFLKKASRIMALLMVMGLCLLIYALAEHQLRTELIRHDETLPDQKGKPTQRITMRRIFQVFEGIDVLTIRGPTGRQRSILNLTDLHRRILELLGPHVQKCYFLLE